MRNSRVFLIIDRRPSQGEKGEPPVIHFGTGGKADSHDVNDLFARKADFL
jgi:hypothetical protein